MDFAGLVGRILEFSITGPIENGRLGMFSTGQVRHGWFKDSGRVGWVDCLEFSITGPIENGRLGMFGTG
jgi:hypothetical protein